MPVAPMANSVERHFRHDEYHPCTLLPLIGGTRIQVPVVDKYEYYIGLFFSGILVDEFMMACKKNNNFVSD